MLLTIMLAIVIIPVIGLAIDGGIAYLIKTRLSAAVDAAALAGARSLSVGIAIDDQKANARKTARDYLNANFPAGLLQTYALVAPDAEIVETGYKTRTVSVQASVSYPLYFLRIIGFTAGQAAASGQAARRDVNVILALDRSGSMAGSPCTAMKAAAQSFADKFVNGRDRLGLITFKASAHLDYNPTLNFKVQSPSLKDTIGQINCSGSTGSAQALSEAWQQIQLVNEPGALNLIVFFTDGLPNGIAAQFELKQAADVRYGVSNTAVEVATPATTCADTPGHTLTGIISQGFNYAPPTGSTSGLMDPSGTGIASTADPLISAPGCSFLKSSGNIRKDVASYAALFPPTGIPVDINGNDIYDGGYKPLDTYSSGPYAGMYRVDTPAAIQAASYNAADSAAKRIHNDTMYTPVIFSIGFGSNVDPEFLQRVANDTHADNYDAARAAGLYVYAPNSSQLSAAFNRVASEILRLAK